MTKEEFWKRVDTQLHRPNDRERYALRDELEAHIEDHALELEDAGCCPEEAEARAVEAMGEPEEIGKALNTIHVDYDVITAKNLAELPRYHVIILSNVEMLSDEEVAALHAYVQAGGRLYVSGRTGMSDPDGHVRDESLLSELLGVRRGERFPIQPNYIAPTADAPALFGEYTRRYPHMLSEQLVQTSAPDSRILATVTLPLSDKSDSRVYASAISNPPMRETDFAALTEHDFGAGRVIYSAGMIEESDIPDNMKLFTSLIDRLMDGGARVRIDAPPCVDHTVYESERDLKVYLLNYQSFFPPVPIASIRIDIDLKGRRVKHVKDISGGRVEWLEQNGILHLDTDLNIYKMILIDTE